MTLQQAIQSNVRLQLGPKVSTFGGWCRHDKVFLDGQVIGRIQTRRGKGRFEIITIANNVYIPGYDIDWLVKREGRRDGFNPATARSI